MKELKDMTTKEILAEYNRLTQKDIKRFASRAAAEKQLAAARAKAVKVTVVAPAKAAKTKKVKAAKKVTKLYTDRNEAARETWGNRAVAAKRAERNGVAVAGHGSFKSVAAAFQSLKLPMGKHIRFRGLLKADGKAEIDGFKFTLTAKKEAA